MQHPDHRYIEALLNNDAPLLKELYRKHFGKIQRMVLNNNGTEAEASDLFQDALLSIFKKARTEAFTLTCPLDAFLYIICKNKWMNELNKNKTRGVTISDPEGYNDISDDSLKLAEDWLIQESRQSLLVEKLENLGDSCRRLLYLSWSGKSMNEVAEMLKLSYGYARKKKSECMAKLISLVRESPQFNSLKW
ncbi:MAG TPA: sigma-70 family RNA polymerase sigma factor [Puia sp.]|nr:sigma-70 family RNA polymerase sigma factor [Puia sp.]